MHIAKLKSFKASPVWWRIYELTKKKKESIWTGSLFRTLQKNRFAEMSPSVFFYQYSGIESTPPASRGM